VTARAGGTEAFATRIAGVFGTRVVAFLFAVTASFLMARLLGPDGRGVYGTVTTFAGMLFTFAQLGLPSAVTFFAGGGRSVVSLRRASLLLTAGISTVFIGVSLLLLPLFDRTIAQTATSTELVLGLAALPILLANAMGGGILYGRHATRNYNLIQLGQAISTLVAVIVLVGILQLGVLGALVGFLLVNGLAALAVLLEVRRLERKAQRDGSAASERPIRYRELLGYSGRLYPASVTSYFNYRADVLLLNAFGVAASSIGLYAVAVQFAELLFYVPDSIATIFYPTVAGSTREEADPLARSVTRFTVLLALGGAVLLLPAAAVAILVILPQYRGSIGPLIVLLPAVVSLSVSKVLAGYLSGLGRPGAATTAASTAMVVNIGLNIVLIPVAGIMGAALASLVSYTLHATIMVAFASRLSGVGPAAFLVPRRSEVTRLRQATRLVAGRVRSAARRPAR
jgi:O-antigen/teichoic acid export membrane protein